MASRSYHSRRIGGRPIKLPDFPDQCKHPHVETGFHCNLEADGHTHHKHRSIIGEVLAEWEGQPLTKAELQATRDEFAAYVADPANNETCKAIVRKGLALYEFILKYTK